MLAHFKQLDFLNDARLAISPTGAEMCLDYSYPSIWTQPRDIKT